MGTSNLITTLIHFHCQKKRNKGPLFFALEVPMQFRLLDAPPLQLIIIIIDKTDAGLNGLCIRDITLIYDVINTGDL